MKIKSRLKRAGYIGAVSMVAGVSSVSAGTAELTSDISAVAVKRVVATEMRERSKAKSGFKWESDERAIVSNTSTKRVASSSQFKWDSINESPSYANKALTSENPASVASLNGFRWGVRSASTQNGFRWGVRNTADQKGFRWGVRSVTQQAGFRWGVRNVSEQNGFRWGVRSDAIQNGFRWGVR